MENKAAFFRRAFAVFLAAALAALLTGCAPLRADVPDGFAAARDRKGITMYSPDGFKARVKTERNTPERDTAFWGEALRTQLEKRGYRLIEEKKFSSDFLKEGVAIEWLMPLGNDYYSYMTAVSARGSRIYIMEAAGERKLFEKYGKEREAILYSIR